MDRGKLSILEESEDLRARGIEALAFVLEVDYKEAEELVDEMNRQLEEPDYTQSQYELVMDAEFSY